ncbi:MAG: hypothetical protein JWP97_2478 [Labilithrix sp.]|nr:hypothetical protein [Labilithrix sp.]
MTLRRVAAAVAMTTVLTLSSAWTAGCAGKTVAEAESKHDVAWLADDGSPLAVAALGRLGDSTPAAVAALERRATGDVNAYIAAWEAVTRGATWGTTFLRSALADPLRADTAATALPRRDPRLVPFGPDLEGAVVRLAAGHRGSVVAGVLASIGPTAHAQVERRLLDPKTRGAMCDGVGLPEASGDAKSLLLAVPPDARDHAACVDVILSLAAIEDVVLDWLAVNAEPGLVGATAKSTLPCPRLGILWSKALVERAPETHSALAVPLSVSLRRCASTLDPIIADLLLKAPRSRGCIMQAIDPYSAEASDLRRTCTALRGAWVASETGRVRERANDALTHGCRFVR